MSEQEARPSDDRRRRVLVVDDEALIRWWLCESLTERGHAASEAGDGRTALRLLDDGLPLPDVVLLDYRLPDSEDLELLSKIVRHVPDGRIVLMTAYGVPNLARDAMTRGAHSVLSKPFDLEDVLDVVEQVR